MSASTKLIELIHCAACEALTGGIFIEGVRWPFCKECAHLIQPDPEPPCTPDRKVA